MDGGRAAAKAGKSRERLEWIDAAKGVGIVAVVVGHVWTRGAVRDAVYAFHMPLFFLISGYLFRPQPSLHFARKQIETQGLSYVLWLALAVGFDVWFEGWRGVRPVFHDWPEDLWRVAFGGSDLRGPFTVFWFVPCLIVARIICNVVGMRFPARLGWPWLAIAGVSLILAYAAGRATDVSPLGLLTVPMALVLLWVGWVWADVPWRPVMWLPLMALAAGVLAFGPAINMKAGDYGWPLWSMAGAVAISFLIFRAARFPIVNIAPLRRLGAASLTVMYMHVPIVHYGSGHLPKPALLALAVLVPFAVHYLLKANGVTARLLLGVANSRASARQPWSFRATSATRLP